MSSWRTAARTAIAAVLEEHRTASLVERRRALRRAYPFGERRGWPYRVWLDEVKRANRLIERGVYFRRQLQIEFDHGAAHAGSGH